MSNDEQEEQSEIDVLEAQALEFDEADSADGYYDYRAFDDIFDFEIFRSELFFPRARYWRPEYIQTREEEKIARRLKQQGYMQKDEIRRQREIDREFHQIRLLFNEPDLTERYDEIVDRLENGKKVLIDQKDFNLIKGGRPKEQLNAIMEERLDQGFIMAHLFWFMLRVKVHIPENYLIQKNKKNEDVQTGKVATIEAFRQFIKKHLANKNCPGTDTQRSFSEEDINTIKRLLWPSAHLWAALYGPNAQYKTKDGLKEDFKGFSNIVAKADGLFKLAKEHGVYQAIVPQRFDESLIVSYDGVNGSIDLKEVKKLTSTELKNLKKLWPAF
jgi:hypothetical protein